jgi:4-hydroxy-2-oxoglutarate aldolase
MRKKNFISLSEIKKQNFGGTIMSEYKMHGIYAPIPTPFTDAMGPIAYDKLAKNMDFWNKSRLEGVVVLGSNGEFVMLDFEEKKELISKVCELAKGKKHVIAGCGCESTRDTIKLCEYAARAGADAALLINPNYYKRAMTDAVNENYYRSVADASPVPVIVYNMPGNTGINLSSALVAKLAAHKNIIGVKDSGGNIVQITEIIRDAPRDFSVFAGSASFLLATLMLGGTGGTLALANIFPNECAEVQSLQEDGKYQEAAALQKKLIESNTAVTARWGIAGLKAAMELRGLEGGVPRSPMLPLRVEDRVTLTGILEKATPNLKV